MRKPYLLSTLLLTLLLGKFSLAQDFSNKGKEFWLSYSYHVGMSNGQPPTMTLYLTSDAATTYTVEIFGVTTLSTGNIAAGAVVPVVVPTTYFINNEGLFTGRSIRVTADKNITVYAYITRSAVSGATLCLPTPVLGKEYYSANFTQVSNENLSNSYFTIVAIEDNTTVEITPTGNTKNGWVAGTTYTVNLNKGQIYQVLGTTSGFTGSDLTGSLIRSVSSGSGGCKRIAVFSGSGKIRIPGSSCSNNSSDNLFQQLYPVASWGKKYLTVPSFNRPNNYYRIIRSSPTASVFINGVLVPAGSFTGNYFQFFNSTPNNIESDQPIAVMQYFTTQGCDGNGTPYDPDMVVLNPVEQNISNVTLVSSNMVASPPQHHLHVIMKNGPGTGISSFRLDGAPVPAGSWVPHPNDAAYSYIYLSNVAQGYHTLSSDSGFLALAYGYAPAESYAYSAGANVKDLYQFVSVQNQFATVNFPATCRNSPFFFKMTFPYQPTTITWDLGSLGTFNMPNPATYFIGTTVVNGKTLYQYQIPNPYSIPTAGTYPIRVTATNPTSDGCGGSQEINYDLQVFNSPVADFNFSNVCFPNPVTFTDNSNTDTRPITTRYWDFGDASTGSNNNPTHTYAAPGAYNVRYAIITDIGCISDTTEHIVNVSALPTASISGATQVCIGDPSPSVTFTGATGQAPYTFTYTINGGTPLTATTSSGNSVSIPVPTTTAGTFTYALVSVSDASPAVCSQPQSGTAVVQVNTVPTASIAGGISVCRNAASPNITFTGSGAAGPYTFTYNINGGSSQTVTTSSGSSVTVAVPTATAGTFTYNLLSVQSGGSGSCSQVQTGSTTVTVNDLPTASISGTTEVCLNAASPTINFTGATGTAPYTFTYTINGGPNQTVSSTGSTATIAVPTGTAGTFTYTLVSVVDASSTVCSQAQTGTATVIVNPLPTPDFSISAPSCETRSVSFTNLSVANAGTINAWSWNFGDAGTASTQNPTHTYAAAGTYNVTLSVTTDKGCTSNPVLSRPVTINPLPVTAFVLPEVCLSDTYAQFTDNSTVAPGTISNWSWNFGDPGSGVNNTSTLQHPQHSYTATGNYTVTLTVTSSSGCTSTLSQPFVVNGDIPVANFNALSPGTMCANDSIAIQDASTVNFGSITKVEIYWDNIGAPGVFETDNNPVPGKIYRHLYPNFQAPLTRTFDIRYRAYSGGTCVNDRVKTIQINAAPLVQFNAIPNTCFDAAPFQLTQASETGGVPGSAVFSGPGVNAGGLFNPALVGPGTYTIKYTFTSTAGGCVDSLSRTILVYDTASARFTQIGQACERSAVQFNSSTSSIPASAGTITGWAWDFGDPASGANNFSTLQNPTHVFSSGGTFNVSLVVISSNGCRSTIRTQPVVVNPLPRPNFSFPPSACLPSANIQFNNLSTIPDNSQSSFSYLWDFGDPGSGANNSSTGSSPSHIYSTAGPFSVNLQVTSGAGCVRDTTIVVNTIHPEPTGSFNVDKTDICVGETFTFTDNSNPADGTTQQWNWNMGDGNTRTTPTFSYTYTTAGSFTVNLFITNSHGCRSSSFNRNVTVNAYPVVNAGPDLFILEDGSDTLQPIVTATNPTYLWTPNQYFLSSNTIRDAVVKGVQDITYTLTVTGRGGCTASDQVFVKVLKGPQVPNIFSPNGDGVHDRWEIKYLDTYPGGTVEVFNRYGQLIFRSVGYGVPWDGTVNGKPVPMGTYYYIVDPKNGRQKMSGYVDVIR